MLIFCLHSFLQKLNALQLQAYLGKKDHFESFKNTASWVVEEVLPGLMEGNSQMEHNEVIAEMNDVYRVSGCI